MTNHMDIFEFCLLYIGCFTALLSLTPLGSFPPRDITYTTPALFGFIPMMEWSIPWYAFIGGLGTAAIASIITVSLLGNVTVAGSGVNLNVKYVSTIIAGFTISAGLGTTLTQMMPTSMPVIANFFLVWIWVVLLCYSVIIHAGAGGTGN